jgi:predicted cupin superfamily sugar epimerase
VGKAARPLATSIYYLLTPESPVGFLHMNKSVVRAARPVPSSTR